MALIAVILIGAFSFSSGCGSLHIGGETHTHIRKRSVIETDDAAVSFIVRLINKAQAMSEPVEQPLRGFDWDDKLVTKYEKKQKEDDDEF